jgi:hypothetical protein
MHHQKHSIFLKIPQDFQLFADNYLVGKKTKKAFEKTILVSPTENGI